MGRHHRREKSTHGCMEFAPERCGSDRRAATVMPVLDASLLISMYLGNDANFAAANRWAERSLRDREKWAIPIIALAEVAAGISRNTQMAAPAVELGAILANLEQ